MPTRWLSKRRLLLAGLLLVSLIGVERLAHEACVRLIITPMGAQGPQLPIAEDVAEVITVERDDAQISAWVFRPDRRPRGTILLLHGLHDSKLSSLPRARHLSRLGFQTVAVDLRAHGNSTGEALTYGVADASDLSAMLDVLQARHHLFGFVGVLGTSYGAATAIQLAARDPRVQTAVALASFSSLRQIVADDAIRLFGTLGRALPQLWIDSVVDEAGARAHFDPDEACPRCVAPTIGASLLLIHGLQDTRITIDHSVAIERACARTEPDRCQLLRIDGAGHQNIGAGPGVSEAIDAWFERVVQRG